jgi:hypothetical protein
MVDNPGVFAQRYGNMFVRGLDRGGLFLGVFRLDVHSEKDQQDISAKLEGSYGLFSASVATRVNEVRSHYRCDALVSMYHEGGPVDLQINDPTRASSSEAVHGHPTQSSIRAAQDYRETVSQ